MEASSTFLSESNNLLLSNLGFDELLALADAAWAHSNASLPASNHDDDDGLRDHQDPSTFTLKSHCMDQHDHLSLDQHSIIIHHNPQDAGTSCTDCSGTTTSQVAPPIPDNVTRDERRQDAALQINMEEKEQGQERNNVSAKNIDNNGTPHSKEGQPKTTLKPVSPKPVQSNNDQNGKRMCVRKKMLTKNSASPTVVTIESTKEVMPKSAARSLNFDKGARHESSADKENATGNLGKRTGAITQEVNAGLSYELNSSMNQALNSYKSLPEYTQAPRTSSESNPPGAKPKDNPTGRRKYVRRKSLDKPSAPTTEVTGEMNADLACDVNTSLKPASNSYMSLTEDTQATNTPSRRKPNGAKPKESPTSKKYVRRSGLNKSSTPTEMFGDLIGEMMPKSAKTSCRRSLNFDKGARDESSADREMEVGLAYDLNSSMKRAENDHMSLPDEQAPSTSPSKRNPPGAKPKENPTGKRRHARRKILNNSPTPPTEMAKELTEAMMPESKEMSWRMPSNFDIGTKDESYTGRGILNEHIGNVAEETPVGLAYNQDTWIQHALKSYISLPEYTQAPKTSSKNNPPGAKPKESPTVKRKYVRKKRVNKTSTPTEMTGELTEPIMSESTTISCRSSLNFDNGGKGESNTCRESPACEQNTSVKATLYMPSSENTQSPSTSLSKSNPTGAKQKADSVDNKKRKGLTTAHDGNIHNSQTSTIRSQGVGSKRKNSGTIKCADNSSMNLIGAHYNGLPSYQSKFQIQFPNIQKKRRTEKGKTSDTQITSCVTTKKGAPLTCTQEDAQAHHYASNSSCWMYGSGYNAAIVPAVSDSTKFILNNSQTFDEFVLSLRMMTERFQPRTQTCDCNSLMRIRNCDAEPNYTAKPLGILEWQSFGDTERPQTCTDIIVSEMCASHAKKKRNRNKIVLSSPAHSSISEMQQHHNFALGNHHLPLGKSSGIADGVIWKTMHDIEALAEQFRQLNINTEARHLALHEQNALVPFQDSFDPIKKQRPRPKVDLDEETDRVWKLLMLDINSHGIDGTDEDKAKWWEEERNVFRGRADSFIARMHLVQGDRRFSRWKGSVVDSVVGVFLTQNVSDHLSSSAFMSLAARFPKKLSSSCETYHGEGTSLVVDKQEVHIVEPEENTEWDVKLLKQSVYDQGSMTVDIVEHSGEKTVNSNDSCRITSSVISLKDESDCRLSEPSQINIKEHHSPMRSGLISAMIEEGEEKSCYDDARKELNDIVSFQCSVISSQLSGDFSNDQNPEKIGSCSDSNSEVEDLSSSAKYNCTSFSKLLEMVSSPKFHEVNSQRSRSTENLRDAHGQSMGMKHDNPTESLKKSDVTQGSLEESITPSNEYNLRLPHNSGVLEVNCSGPFKAEASSSGFLKNKDENDMNRPSLQTESAGHVAITHSQTIVSQVHPQEHSNQMQQSFFDISGQTQDLMQKDRGLDLGDHKDAARSETNEISSAPTKLKSRGQGKEKHVDFDWDSLRIKAQAKAGKREKTENTMDSLDWDAVRCADVSEIANTIKERGMNNRLAERIQNFLNRLVEEHGSIDLEWLRDVPPDQAKEYLLSIRGLGLKSVECVRLLTLHHLAFPVDTNVGRIAVRLGWVPLQPLPESLQLHLLEMYPVLESIQKYLWPRLCKLDQRTLYELHYQMITFGKVFCTKSKPNCNACPMRGECRHFASAFASARLALPGPEQRSIVSTAGNNVTDQNPSVIMSQLHLPLPENTNQVEEIQQTEVSRQLESRSEINICQPIIEEPTTPEPECSQVSQNDMEDAFYEDSCEIPTIKLNIEEFTLNLQNYMQENMELQEGEMSKALVALNPAAASIPMPKLKNISRLRTEHCVYELPDTHPLLEGWDMREPDDPGKYLLAIWTPGETANSIQPPESKCSFREESGQLCNEKECFSCNSFREANSQIVRGTILIPCRTAMRGSFPLNGTYFQVNEVFADHDSSLNPISVPRSWIWNLNRRTVCFGTSIPTIFKGLSTQEIQQCFWRGYVCVRGFDRETRAPRPLMARLHFPASKLAKTKENTRKESSSATASKVAKTKEKTRKGSSSTKSKEPKQNPENPQLITNSDNLQERGTA